MAGWTAERLADIPDLLEAFGANVVAASTGGRLVAAHDERGSGQQELYLVLEGGALFELDGERVELKRGYAVAVTDPSVWRSARALAAGTALLIVGAGGEPFRSLFAAVSSLRREDAGPGERRRGYA